MSGRRRLRSASLFTLAVAALACGDSPKLPDAASATLSLAALEYEASPSERGLQAPNRAHAMRTYFAPSGIEIHARAGDATEALLGLRLTAIGRDDSRRAIPPGEVSHRGARVEITRPSLLEWYLNSPRGLEQGFSMGEAPAGSGELWLELEVDDARVEGEGAIELSSTHGRRFRYDEVRAWDATGRVLAARIEPRGSHAVRLVVDDGGATYPLAIDPLLTSVPDALLRADQADAGLGVSVASAGDVNGDGYGDVIVGALLYDAGESDEGAAFVFLGGASGVASASPASAHARLESDQSFALFGWSVASAGDVNGDGYSDVIVGAPYYDAGQEDEGAAFVFLGSPVGIASQSAALAQARLESDRAGGGLGTSVASAGDVNGDGFDDVVSGAPYYPGGLAPDGAALVFYGSAAGVTGGGPTTASARVVSDRAGAAFGASVSTAGDVNSDGYADLLVGAPGYDGGAMFVFLGSASGIGDGSAATADATLVSDQSGASLGASVAAAGDVNGDGYGDVIVGAPLYDAGEQDEGAAFVFLGGAAGIPAGTSANPHARLESNQPGAGFGESVARAGDTNGDGWSDVVVGAPSYDAGEADEGGAFVFAGGMAGIASGGPSSASASLQANQAGAQLGHSVAPAGDVNGDGFADILAGAPGYEVAEADEGAAFVFSGSAKPLGNRNPQNASASLVSGQAGAQFGTSVASAGDVNGDGFSDVIIGAPSFDAGVADGGAAFVFLGSGAGIMLGGAGAAHARLDSDQAGAQFGQSVASAGDVNGDGYGDVVVGAPAYDAGSTDEGAAFVFLGGAAGLPSVTTAGAQSRLESDQPGAAFGRSVATAGDVNGDGYADLIVGADRYDAGSVDEGAAFVFLGSASGIPSAGVASAHARLESNASSAEFGTSVASAGDVNGDGFADVIVGSPRSYPTTYPPYFTPGAFGAAFVFAGSAAGIGNRSPENADAVLSALIPYSRFGQSVASAGDVNGDGYSDVIVGAPYYTDGNVEEGAVFVFAGSSSGITSGSSTSALLQIEANQFRAQFGQSVASAGDVDGDGRSDLLVGSPTYDAADLDEGAAFEFSGSSPVIFASPPSASGHLEADQQSALLGSSVAPAGDVNGDGFADLIIGAPGFDGTAADEGAAFALLGNSRAGRLVRARQQQPSAALPIASAGISYDPDEFAVLLHATHPDGRGRVKLQLERCAAGVRFGLPGCVSSTSATWTDVGVGGGGVALTANVVGAPVGTVHRWRARVLYAGASAGAPGSTPPFAPPHGPWRRLEAQRFEGDVRTAGDLDVDGIGDPVDNCVATANPGQSNLDADVRGDACDNCPLVTNPDQLDTDADDLGNLCDDDDDGDGLPDSTEASLGTNPLDFDTDDDALSDGAEATLYGTDPLDADSDDDSRLDGVDNCRLAANTGQANADADGFGDACDNCRRTTNPDQLDRGRFGGATTDGVGDACQNADLNGDGRVDLLDIVLARRALAGLEPTLDPGLPPGP